MEKALLVFVKSIVDFLRSVLKNKIVVILLVFVSFAVVAKLANIVQDKIIENFTTSTKTNYWYCLDNGDNTHECALINCTEQPGAAWDYDSLDSCSSLCGNLTTPATFDSIKSTDECSIGSSSGSGSGSVATQMVNPLNLNQGRT